MAELTNDEIDRTKPVLVLQVNGSGLVVGYSVLQYPEISKNHRDLMLVAAEAGIRLLKDSPIQVVIRPSVDHYSLAKRPMRMAGALSPRSGHTKSLRL